MRLFLIGLWIVVVATACKSEQEPKAGALRVDLSYATFRPGCLKITATDRADSSRTVSQEVTLGSPTPQSQVLTVAVFREKGWSRDLTLTATAYESTCAAQNPRQVATQTVDAQVPEKSVVAVPMELRAEDLDDDGFVRTDQGGSDCDDDDKQINPRATESCNGRDENCSGDESDAPGVTQYFADADGDGFGNPLRLQVSCAAPAGHVTNNRDCNDTNPSIRPDQPEALCDGQDDNCSGTPDETFNVGMQCQTAQACAGAFVCQGTTGTACVSPQTPTDWFLDRDGDAHAGTPAGTSCTAPPGAVSTTSDCDDTSPFVFNVATEKCDRLDNNCNLQVDEGCTARDYVAVTGVTSSFLRAVASYAENKAWVAGDGNTLAHVEGTNVTPYTDCPSRKWVSAWAHPNGRIFLGSDDGLLATRGAGGGSACVELETGRSSSINGLVGIRNGSNATLFAVTSEGRIFEWSYTGTGTGTVREVGRVAANLRAIDGTSTTSLVTVGAESVNSVTVARAFAKNPVTGAWTRETLPATLPGSTFLRAVHMVHGQLAYAAGDNGVVVQRANGQWSELPRLPSAANARDVAAYGRTSVYAVSNSTEEVYLFNGSSWSRDLKVNWTPFAIDGVGPHDLWVVGDQGNVVHRGP
ncbi:MAG TPA: putative metal-binding motif-containing protein [Myxococcaceae bacterium]|nr:putative metal-binding motif-containing protein [Myxococcaceae bacterium]